MDRDALTDFVKDLLDDGDASSIHTKVTSTIEAYIGGSMPSRISEEQKPKAIKMVKKIIKCLEDRLCNEPELNVIKTRFSCDNYMNILCTNARRFEFLKTRCDFIPCLEHWGMLDSVEETAVKILEEIKELSTIKKSRGEPRKRSRVAERTIPIPRSETSNRDAAYSVLVASTALIRVFWSRRIEEKGQGAQIVDLAKEMDLWFRFIKPEDQINGKPIREWLISFLSKCTLSLLDERQDTNASGLFCEQTLKEFGDAGSMIDEMLEFGRGICRSLFSKKDDAYFQESEILFLVLEYLAIQCKKLPGKEQPLAIFLDFVGYSTIEYGEASADQCITLAAFFHHLVDKHFPKVHFPHVGMVMEHYALALVVNDPRSCKKWPNVKFSNAVSIQDILNKLEPHLEEFILIKNKTHTEFPAFLSDQIATFILSNYEEMIHAAENSINLPSIGDFLGRFMELGVSARCEAKLAVTSFVFLLITQQDTKGFFDRLKKDGKYQTRVLTNFCQRLRTVYQTLLNCGTVDKAIETLKLCSEASWMQVSLFGDVVTSSEDLFRSNSLLEDSMVYTVNEAAADSASLLRLVHEHCTQEVVDNTLRICIERWVLAQKKFKILSPTALVKEWVMIQCQKIAGKNLEDYLAPTIPCLVPSLTEQESCIIIVEELHAYRSMQIMDSEFLKRMEKHIQDSLSGISNENIIDTFRFLIDGGVRLASLGHQGQLDCIIYISEAVNLLKCNEGDIHGNIGAELSELLPNAYFWLSIIKRLAYPMQKDFTEDIKSGLKYWEKPHKFNHTEYTLLSCILDLLPLEANVELQREVYEIMLKSPGKEFLGIALQSGNIHHALCSSPVNDAKHSSLSSTGVPYPRTRVMSESLEAGTYHSLSLPTVSYLELDDDTPKAQKTMEEVKHRLITRVYDPKNRFAAAHDCYNLAEIMIGNGLMTEALTCAKESYHLRNLLLLECFLIEWEEETLETNKYVCKTFYPNPSWFLSVGSVGTKVYVPTPWNLLRCFLDSALQNGTLHHMVGNSYEAADMLYHGKTISSNQNFPVFLIGFSIALGNLHCDKKEWSSATTELESARKSLAVCSHNLCKKCRLVLEVKLDQLEGDINLSIFKNKGEIEKDALRKAKDSFEKAKRNLEKEEWVNSVSKPDGETPKENNPVLCFSNEDENNKDCWHCQTSVIEKSSSLEDLTNLKWEVTRRRYLLQVLTKLAKCYRLEEDVNEERKFLMAGIQVLVGRSTFKEMELSSSFVEKLVREKVVAEALGAEQALILYKTCCFSLRHEGSRERAILSRDYVVHGLKMAFLLSREVPKVHEKVSQTLAVVYACSSKDVTHSKPQRAYEILSASYFHQCSIGSHFNSRFLLQDQNKMDVDGSSNLRRVLAPRSMKELEESISDFLEILPRSSVTVLCISMFSGKSYGILHKFLPESLPTFAWLMMSRFDSKKGPIVVIFPISETFKALQRDNTSICELPCPWAGNTFDKVAPLLRWVLEEDIRRDISVDDSNKKMKKKVNLDNILCSFLRNLEDAWLGPWKYLLLGECSDDVDDNGHKITNEMEQHCSEQLRLNHGCYIGPSGGKVNKSVEKIRGATKKKKCRNPVIIVSQLDIQMIPFESLPVLQEQEVYRMPSVGSILRSINRNPEPVVNPYNCYYMIPEPEDVASLIKCFKEWNFEGNAGMALKISVDEIKEALESHELFIWVCHGDGTQFFSQTEIGKVSNCCATILMGCSSGFLYSRNHAIEGAPLDYLLAGSSIVVANLWSVRTTSVNSFTMKLFDTWTKATSSDRVQCKLRTRNQIGVRLCEHESNLGSSMDKARAACEERYLLGAASVIYGIPTKIAENMPQ